MKKTSIILLGLILTTVLFTYSQESTQKSEGQLVTKTFTKKDYSHWSLFVDFGLNTFAGDMKYDLSPTFEDPLGHWSLGGGIEYRVNPMFAIGLGYDFHRIGAEDQGGSFVSDVHNVYPFIGFNLLNYPMLNRNNKWNLWFTAGVGYAFYNPELTYANNYGVSDNDWYAGSYSKSKNETSCGVIPFGAELSYDISRQFAIALKAKAFMYLDDNLEGATGKLKEFGEDPYNRKNYTYSGVTNDNLGSVALSLRWNITGKDKVHVSRLTWIDDYRQTKDNKYDDVLARLDLLEKKVDEIEEAPAPVIIYDSNESSTSSANACLVEPIFIFFDFDKFDLSHDAMAEILKVATILHENEDLVVEIVGYTDIKGTDPYNDKLSKRRADVAKNELINVWGVSSNRILDEGRGKALSPKPELKKYHSINRRCEFRFYKK